MRVASVDGSAKGLLNTTQALRPTILFAAEAISVGSGPSVGSALLAEGRTARFGRPSAFAKAESEALAVEVAALSPSFQRNARRGWAEVRQRPRAQ